MLIECPWCGPRNEDEFHCGGAAGVAYPENPSALDDDEWAHFLFYRENPKGPLRERWLHQAGCRRWFTLLRDTAASRVLSVDPAAVPVPIPLGVTGGVV